MASINIHDILAQFGEEALNNLYLGDRIGRYIFDLLKYAPASLVKLTRLS